MHAVDLLQTGSFVSVHTYVCMYVCVCTYQPLRILMSTHIKYKKPENVEYFCEMDDFNLKMADSQAEFT